LRGGENCCHGDRLGTQDVGATREHHNKTKAAVSVAYLYL